jgi:hypothetical protein
MKTTVKLKITVTVDAEQFISEVLGTDYIQYDWWYSEKYLGNYDWNRIPTDHDEKFISVIVYDPNTYESDRKLILKKLSVNDIANAYGSLIALGFNLDYSDMDSVSGDNVIQYACFGDLVYG